MRRPLSSSPAPLVSHAMRRAELSASTGSTLADVREPALACFRLDQVAGHLGRREPRGHREGLDAGSLERGRERLGQAHDAGLPRRVSRLVRRRANSDVAREVDDAPSPSRIMRGTTSRQQMKAPPRLVRTSSHQSSGSTSQSGPIARNEPALFTSTVIRSPACCSIAMTAWCIAGVGDVGRGADSRRSALENQTTSLLEIRIRPGHEPDGRTRPRQARSQGASDSSAGSGDDGNRARGHGTRSRSSCCSSVAAASRIARYGRPDRSAIAIRS